MKKRKTLRSRPPRKDKDPRCPATGRPLGMTRRQLQRAEAEARAHLEIVRVVDELEQKNGTGVLPLLGLPMRLVSGAFLSMVPSEAAQAAGAELLRRHVMNVLPQVIEAALGQPKEEKR